MEHTDTVNNNLMMIMNTPRDAECITEGSPSMPPYSGGTMTSRTTPPFTDESTQANIFVCHLDPSIDDDALRSMFEPFGIIESSVVMRDIFSGASRGIAFVQFADEISAALAIEKMNNAVVNEKRISVQPAKKYARGTPTARVFVRNIPNSVTESDVYDVFAPFGDIACLSIHADSIAAGGGATNLPHGSMRLPQGATATVSAPRNIGFITFSTKEAAAAAASAIHNTHPFAHILQHTDNLCESVPVLTKVVMDNLPPKRQRKRAAEIGTSSSSTTSSSNNQCSIEQMTPLHYSDANYNSIMCGASMMPVMYPFSAYPSLSSPQSFVSTPQLPSSSDLSFHFHSGGVSFASPLGGHVQYASTTQSPYLALAPPSAPHYPLASLPTFYTPQQQIVMPSSSPQSAATLFVPPAPSPPAMSPLPGQSGIVLAPPSPHAWMYGNHHQPSLLHSSPLWVPQRPQ